MGKQILIRQKLKIIRKFSDYKSFITPGEYAKILKLARSLAGKKIVYVNSTPTGGGVVEILKNIIPLMRSLGLDVQWCVFDDDPKFFRISKKLHNSLQGSKERLSIEEKKYYLQRNENLSNRLRELRPEILMLQDPQPLGMVEFIPEQIKAVSRIHIDLTKPNPDSLKFVQPMLEKCDKLIFTMPEFVPRVLASPKVLISPPGIDPLSMKNQPLTKKQIAAVAESAGLNPSRPLLVQVSRFDRWKDPIGAVQIYKLVKDDYPAVQLVLMGLIEAQDDPEALEVFGQVKKYVANDPQVFLFSQKSQLRGIRVDTYVNAMQRLADVVLQKSLREGFGLTVTEAMWKGKPVIGGNVGGIRLQIRTGINGFLADSPSAAAKIAVRLISDKNLSQKIGRQASRSVQQNFLITRYLKDELSAASSKPRR